MVKIPDEVLNAINNEKNPKIIATVSPDGAPHAIQAGSIRAPSNEMMIVGAIFMKRTGNNLQAMKESGTPAAFLVLDGMNSYEIRCTVQDFIASGPLFEQMSSRIKAMGLTLQGVWTFTPIEVFNQSPSYDVGKKMA